MHLSGCAWRAVLKAWGWSFFENAAVPWRRFSRKQVHPLPRQVVAAEDAANAVQINGLAELFRNPDRQRLTGPGADAVVFPA